MSNKTPYKKTVAIDIREACSEQPAGKGIYNLELIKQLVQSDDFGWILISDTSKLPRDLVELEKKFTLEVINQKGLMWHFTVRKILKNIDIYFAPTSYITPYLLRKKEFKKVVTVHDLIAFKFPEGVPLKAKIIEKLLLPKIVKTVNGIITVSENTKIDLFEMFPNAKSSAMVSTGLGTSAKAEVSSNERKKIILSVSSILPRKNYIRLLNAFEKISSKIPHKLVIAGAPMSKSTADKLRDFIKSHSLESRVDLLGYTDYSTLQKLYSEAEIFVYPSLYEGFGLPLLEAFAHNCPVTCSETSSLPEVAGPAALFFDPYDLDEMSKALFELTQNSELREQIAAEGRERLADYTWESTAEKTLELFNKL